LKAQTESVHITAATCKIDKSNGIVSSNYHSKIKKVNYITKTVQKSIKKNKILKNNQQTQN